MHRPSLQGPPLQAAGHHHSALPAQLRGGGPPSLRGRRGSRPLCRCRSGGDAAAAARPCAAAARPPPLLRRRPRAHVVPAGAGKGQGPPPKQQQQKQQPQQQQQALGAAPGGAQAEQVEEDDGEWDEEWEDGEWEEQEEGEEWEDEEAEEEEEDEEAEEDEEEAAAPVPARTFRQIPNDLATVEFTPDDFVEVGLISRPHGVRGEVKVQLITDEPKKRLGTPGTRLWLRQPPPSLGGGGGGGAAPLLQRVTVQSGRVARPASRDRRAEWAVKFQEVPGRTEAAVLAGRTLLLALCDREASPRGRDEFFVTDLVGSRVLAAAGRQLLGLVTEVYDGAGGYSLLRVRLAPDERDIEASRYRSLLVPFVSSVVPSVDVAARELLLDAPEGLLETASARKLRRPYTPEQQAQLRAQLEQRRAAAGGQQGGGGGGGG